MHIIIIGGGTGGLALAQALHNYPGLQVSCYEREPKATGIEQGYRVEVNNDGCNALKQCLPASLFERFEDETEQGYKLTLANEQLQPLVDHIGYHFYRPVDRFFLRELLQNGLEGVLHIGMKFVRYEEKGKKVVAFFEDGSEVEGDLLIGADGANSKVRSQLLPHAERVRTGVVAVICKTKYDESLLPHPHGSVIKCPDGQRMFIASYKAPPEQPSDSSYVFFSLSSREDKFLHKEAHWSQLSQEALRDEILRRSAHYHPKLRHLAEQGILGTYVCLDVKTSVRVAPWETKRVTLLGDALHSMPPDRGEGANTALRDSANLASHIKSHIDDPEIPILQAIASYEKELIERGFQAVEKSAYANLWVHDLE
eukprot:Phypoly_transcript_09909.p1 GENE.Phypoly_transcript_09909~~Phypoly_transcript_09909.p1  ORF type:complete len:369 (+),score=55.78 Phypoly_transcript_09909:75-1181(+)